MFRAMFVNRNRADVVAFDMRAGTQAGAVVTIVECVRWFTTTTRNLCRDAATHASGRAATPKVPEHFNRPRCLALRSTLDRKPRRK